MMREPVQQTYNPALEPDKKNAAPQTGQPTPQPQKPNEPGKLENPSTAQYEVLLEQIAHDMGYEDKLSAEQQALLAKFGYSDGGLINGPFGFEMRSFIPSNPAYPHPILAFRGTEFTKLKDLVADLEPESVGLQQFNANRRRIELELQKLSKHGKVWLTGHSLGGALAQLAGSEFADLTERIITFQSPGIDAKHVASLKKHNKANSNQQVLSTHYQVAGDVVSGVGEALTPGELIKFEMNPSSGASMKHYGIGLIAGAIVGPGTGVAVKEASEKVSKHRAFPVSNAVQENPAFKDLFENGKKFDKVAGISDDTFQAKATLNSDTFQNTRISEFLRHSIGKTSFELENAASNWGGDAKAREFAESNKKTIGNFSATQLLEHLNRLLDGWVSDDDVQAFETICHGVNDPKIMAQIQAAISPRLQELHSEHQRKWIEDAINFKPIPEDETVQRDAIGTVSSKPNFQNLIGGNTLEGTIRKELEEHFNVNLESVRIHTDANAHNIAKDLNAKAAAIGENIILSENASSSDKELIGHEIAHVIQQREGKVSAGIDPDQSLEVAAQLEGRNFAAGTKVRGKRAMLEPKRASTESIQRKEAAKTSDTTWTRDFTGITGKNAVNLRLTRATDGNLKGTYQFNQSVTVEVTGKILESTDNDLFLEGVDGSKWHGKYTETNTLLFGNVVLPKQTLKNLELKAINAIPEATKSPMTPVASNGTTWTREFNGELDGKYSIHMHLERDETKLNGSYYYTKQGAEKAIALTGVMDADSKAVKLEGNGETFNGIFLGEKGDKLEGKWIGGDKTLEFSVTAQKTESGTKSVTSEEMKDLVPLLPEGSGGFSLTTEEKALLRKHQAAGDIVWVFNLPEDNQKQDMKMSENGISELKKYEGYGAEPYQDSSGYWTIGYGHLLDTNKNQNIEATEWKKYDALGFPRILDRDQADQLLRKELTKYENVVNNSVTAPLTQEMFDTLAIMSFNIPAAFGSDSGLLQAINERRYLDMPSEMYRWVYSAGNRVKGLENRRLQEITNFARPYLRKK